VDENPELFSERGEPCSLRRVLKGTGPKIAAMRTATTSASAAFARRCSSVTSVVWCVKSAVRKKLQKKSQMRLEKRNEASYITVSDT
jgi:hypothetical protein